MQDIMNNGETLQEMHHLKEEYTMLHGTINQSKQLTTVQGIMNYRKILQGIHHMEEELTMLHGIIN